MRLDGRETSGSHTDNMRAGRVGGRVWQCCGSVSQGTCDIDLQINTVANNIMLQLYLWHDFYAIIFKVKQIQGQLPPRNE